jgi:tetratricopeptide (TPR) repeat protein
VDGARREAQRALSLDPENLNAAMIIASDQVTRGDARTALETLQRAKVSPEMEIPTRVMTVAILERLGDQARIEAELKKLVELDPKTFRRELVRYYSAQGRDPDAERELRAVAAADPGNSEAFLDVVRFLNARQGAEAAQRELESRIKAGGDVFPYQLALAAFQFERGQYDAAVQGLEALTNSATATPEQKTKARLSLASMHVQRRNFSAAEPIVADILKGDERNSEALRYRATIRLERGQAEAAILDLREALKEQPQSAPLLQLLASALEVTGAIELAEKHYGDAMRASQFNPAFGMPYVTFLQRRSTPQKVEQALTELVERNPKSVPVWTALAQAKLQLRDWKGAQEAADTIRQLGGQASVAVAEQIRSQALAAQNDQSGSLQALQAAVQASPGAVQPTVALVQAYLRAQKTKEAEALVKGVLDANPSSAEALVLMASVHAAKNAPDQALKFIKTAIERQPKNTAGYTALADFHMRRNELDQGLAAVQAGLKEHPDHTGLRLTLGSILEAKRDHEGAIREFEAVLAKEPGSLIAANNVASLLTEHRTDAASLERAQSLGVMLRRSNIPQFKDTVGWLAYKSGDYRTAISLLEEAVEALPSNALVRYHLGMSYRKGGQADKALEHLKKAAELETSDTPLRAKIQAALRES